MPLEPTATSFFPSVEEPTKAQELLGAAVADQETGDVVTSKIGPAGAAATTWLPSVEEQTQFQFFTGPLTEIQLAPAFVETETRPLPKLELEATATSFWPPPEEVTHR